MAQATICRRYVRRNLKSVVLNLFFFLALLRLMTIQASHALRCVLAHFEFVNDRILLPRMAFCTFARRLYKFGIGLVGLNARPRPLYEKCAQNERKRDNNCNKYGTKRQMHLPFPAEERLGKARCAFRCGK